jgi:D-glycero-D-manno-heptose 1,7-bisphosphate phosphatase
MPAKSLFLDRDGTLIVDRHYLSDPAQVELLPGVRDALHGFLAEGWLLFLFTNQSGIGQGMFPIEAVHRCNARMLELLALPAPGFTATCIAPETPDMPPVYRKPSPRFILEMTAVHSLDPARTWMIGDKASDVQAGLNAGVHAALLQTGPVPAVPPSVWRCRDLADFRARLPATVKSVN